MIDDRVLNAIPQVAKDTGLMPDQVYHDHQLVRMAVELCHPLTVYDDVKLVLKGGTALAKQGITTRFSEDIDLGIVPPPQGTFGNKKRDKCMDEIKTRTLALWPDKFGIRSGKWYSRYSIPYHPLREQEVSRDQEPAVKVEVTVNTGIGRYETTELLSLIDEHLEIDTRDEPLPEALCCHPLETLGEKLHALNRIVTHEPSERITSRVRDIYDIACILNAYGHELEPGDINSLYEAANRPEGDRFRLSRLTPIPPDGLRSLDIWHPGTERYTLLKQAYAKEIEPIVYGLQDLSFEQCIYKIQAHIHLM